MTKQTLVVLRVTDDDEAREWWDALGLPDPCRINEQISHAYVEFVVEQRVSRSVTVSDV